MARTRTWPPMPEIIEVLEHELENAPPQTLRELQASISADMALKNPLPLEYVRNALHLYRLHRVPAGMSLVVEHQGRRCFYHLTDDPALVKPHARTRTGTIETHLSTLSPELARLTRVTDGRTLEGQLARALNKGIARMLEDVRDVRAADAVLQARINSL